MTRDEATAEAGRWRAASMLRVLAVAAVFGIVLVLPSASPAAVSLWTGVASVSEEGQSAHAPQVAVDAAGDAVAVWARSNGSNDVVQAAIKPAGGVWGSPATLSAAGEEASEAQIAVTPAGDVTVVWRRFDGSNYVVQAAVKPAGKAWGKPATLSGTGEEASEPQVAVDAAGDGTVVWRRSDGSDNLVQAAVRPADGSWGSPVSLSEAGENASEPRLAAGAAGDAIAVWTRYDGSDNLVQAAVKPAGEPWAKPATVSEMGQEASQPAVAMEAAGDATAVWTRYNGLKENGGSKHDVQTASKPAGKAWEAPARLSEEAGEEGLEPEVAMDGSGEATAIWKRFIYGCCRLIEAAAKPVGKPWETPATFEDGGDPRIAVNAAGDAVAVWTKYHGPGDVVQAAVKPVGEPWVKPATVSEDEASAPQVAVNAAGDATAVWTRYVGSGFGKFIVQAAQYSPSTAFTIETQQKLTAEPTYTKTELNGEAGDTVDYEIIVKNTGSTPLKFGALKDSGCESISPAGPTELEATTEETFTCTHKLTAFVKYSNEASIEGNEGTGSETSNGVTVTLAPVYEAPAGAADSNSGSCVQSRVAVFVCSNLRAAVAYANGDPGSTVKLESGVYQLGEAHGYPSGARAFLEITASMRIQGAGPGETRIEQTGNYPVVVMPYDAGFSKIEIDRVELTGGVAAGNDDGEFFGWEKGGGALRILGSGTPSSSVTLTNDYLTGNLAHAKSVEGGAIFNKRTLNIIDSTIAGNKALAEGASSNTEFGAALGGGIFNLGHLLISGSTIAGNTVEAGGVKSEAIGGGVDSGVENFSNEATAGIANTTITGNIASAGTTTNPPFVYGGGLAIDDGALNHVTLYGNTASAVNASESWGGNVYEPQNGGGTWINNSIVAKGSATEGPNCMFQAGGSYPEDNRNNLTDGPSGECGFTPAYDPLTGVNPQLMALAENGGQTETFAPAPGSPVIGAGADCEGTFGESGSGGWSTATVALDVDQRGMPRNGHCDTGAFQTEPPFATTSPQVSGTAEAGKTLTCTPGAWTGEGTLTYSYEWLRNGVPAGDQSTAYTIVASDAESQIACRVTVTGTYGSTEATSASVRVPKQPQSPPGGPTGESTGTLPGAIEPPPVNAQIEKEFEEHPPWDSAPAVAPKAAAAPGGVSLAATNITVQSNGMALAKLACTGTGTCAGKLTLTVKIMPAKGKRTTAKTKTLGMAGFSIPPGETATVELKLSGAGRTLLSGAHARLSATLTILKSAPAPSQTHSTSVQFVQQKAVKARKSGK
ncbi:MAG: choice-of-anchor Q domain-containing protein [Solirubrobacterales bacterium]